MIDIRKLAAACGAASLALIVATGAARADGYEVAAPAAKEEGRKFTYSFNLDGTSDYVFRGISQTDNDPTIQGGIDIGYGIIYAGWWASGLDFDAFLNDAEVEMDWYGGIKPVWHGVTFDLGTIYYSYPGATFVTAPFNTRLSYWELKAGASGNIHKDWTVGLNIYWSPDYFAETNRVWTFEGNTALTLPKVHIFTPTLSGVLGYQDGNSGAYLTANGFSNYWYWNAGLALAVDNLTFDFRYWGTDASNAVSDTLSCINHYCDNRFVFTAKVVVP